ncbi:putative oxidoreductase YcjS [Novipirellula aureliae]|uniref:Putative oxidoreductase YcjS n=1 Tax=Novipirellula aureliae TaxID=2527966 RepID=A0A5C6DYI9_9BACT|nr:Gfo/Idh/MocA family oxidoreductase [Novipirellula aureliae]TWU40116.1 putative oxidoreductase YcjS [Novipirellula aureliae]
MTTRRNFLKNSALTSAALVANPYILTSTANAAQVQDTDLTIAAIGVGGSRGRYSRGGEVSRQAAKFGKMIAVCDVDERHNAEFNADRMFGGKLKEYVDYRKLIDTERPDIVVIGTNDHWHVPIATYALRAGCDVYCEKPLTLTIDEGKEICKVVKETGKVFQVGTQQRTEMGKRFLKAVAMIQEGYVGDNVTAQLAIGGAPGEGPFPTSKVPEKLNWDFWVGPARAADYSLERRKFFRWYMEYSGGKMTDWGAHHIDIAQWAIGMDKTGPTSISGTGQFGNVVPEGFDWVAFFEGKAELENGYNAATKFSVNLTFENGSALNVHDKYVSEDGDTTFPNGILFEGSQGRLFVNRGKLTGKPVEDLTESDNKKLEDAVAKLYKDKPITSHMQNFFECVKDRSEPISDVYSHHRTMTSCHMCNIALMVGEDLKWDPVKEVFIGNEMANQLMSRPSRSKYLGSPA